MKKNNDELQVVISRSLQIGVLLSAAIILVGFAMFLITGNSGYSGNTFPTNPLLIFEGAAQLKSFGIIMAGLIILILTPVMRVAVSIFVFLKEKDYKYVVISAVVFTILIISFLLGKVE